ncbi:MAG TPA: hypothetical protein VGU67_02985 [Edaphobacter sp.]|nr:hypothetical protein [Edaphobacter sp.]
MKRFLRSSLVGGATAILALSLAVLPIAGCTQADVQKAVALVQAELPTAIALVGDVAPIIIAFAGPQGAASSPIQNTITTVQSDLGELQTLCASYTSAPSTTIYASILKVVDDLVTQGDSALLTAAQIKDPATQQKATVILGSLSAVLHILDGYVQATQSASQVKATAAARAVKLNAVRAYWSPSDKKGIEQAAGVPFNTAYAHAVAMGF